MFRSPSALVLFRSAATISLEKAATTHRADIFQRAWPIYNVTEAVSPSGQRRGIFYCDVGLGPTNSDSAQYFLEKRLSSDDQALSIYSLFKSPQTGDKAQAKRDYEGAFEQVHNRPPREGEITGKPWPDLKFIKGPIDRYKPWVLTFREAVNESMSRRVVEGGEERPGRVEFFLGGIDAKMYIESIITTESETKKSFTKYVDSVDLDTLVNPGIDGRFEAPGGILPTVTSVEFYDATMGTFKDTGEKITYVAKNHIPLDTKTLQNLQEEALSAAREPENIRLVIKKHSSTMTPKAEQAIANLQRYISTGQLSV